MSDMELQPKGRIFIVDDEEDFVLSLLDVLESRNYEVVTANSTKKAREKIQNYDAQVALLDIRIGQNNGIELISELKKHRPQLLCIMMTAYADVDTAVNALHKGAYAFLHKPIDTRDLLSTIERCYDRIDLENEKNSAKKALQKSNESLQILNDRLKKLVDSSRLLASFTNISDIGPKLLEEFANNMGAKGGSLYLKENSGFKLIHSIDPGHASDYISLPMPASSLFKQAIESKKPLLFGSNTEFDNKNKSNWNGYKDDSALIFPIPDLYGEIIGVISLHNKFSPPFSETDKEIGEILVSYSYEILQTAKTSALLRNSEQQYRELMENIPVGVFRQEPGINGKIIMVNSALIQMFGYNSQEEFLKTNIQKHFKNNEDFQSINDIMTKDKQIINKTIQFKTVDGTTIWGNLNAHVWYNEDMKADYIDGTIEDITQKRKSEEMLIQSKKMVSVGGLAAGMAHEINNPLAGIMQNIQIVKNRLINTSPKNISVAQECKISFDSITDYIEKRKIPMLLDIINESGERAGQIVRNMLSFSRKSEHCASLNNIIQIIDDSLELAANNYDLSKKHDFKNIVIKKDYQSDLPFVRCEYSKIQQVIMNIIQNSVEAMAEENREKEKGKTPQILISVKEIQKKIQIEIEDNGPGIPEEIRNRVFEPFFTTKTVGEGTGLGLSISYFIISEDHGGEMYVESEEGKGTKFVIILSGNYE